MDISRRSFVTGCFGAAAAATLAGCSGQSGQSGSSDAKSVENISVSLAEAKLDKDATTTATVTPETDGVTFESSNDAVASVTEDGTVTAHKAGDATITASASGTSASAEVSVNRAVVSGTLTTTVDLTQYEAGKGVRLWLPVAVSDDHQEIKDVTFDAPGATTAEITTDSLGNQMLYVEWAEDADPKTRTAELAWHATRQEVGCPELVEQGEPDAEAKQYLEGSSMVPSNNQQITDAANEIVGNETSYLGKARAIYDWVIANMNRDENTVGCGQGDVCALLSTRSGKCTDINSVFVGLNRAVGVPAREHFGIRMGDADATKAQHCWCEFYLPGTGWVAADPADVLKAVLKNNWSKDSAEAKESADYFWGDWDAKRCQISSGRDLELEPKQAGEPLNDFGYPYAEVDGDALDFYDPANFVYSINFAKDE